MEKFHLLLSPPHTPQLGRGISQNGNGLVGLVWVGLKGISNISYPIQTQSPCQGRDTSPGQDLKDQNDPTELISPALPIPPEGAGVPPSAWEEFAAAQRVFLTFRFQHFICEPSLCS